MLLAGRPTSKIGLRHWPSVLRDVVSFTVQELAQIDLLWNFVEDQGLQDEVQLLPKELDVNSGELHPPLGFSRDFLANSARPEHPRTLRTASHSAWTGNASP